MLGKLPEDFSPSDIWSGRSAVRTEPHESGSRAREPHVENRKNRYTRFAQSGLRAPTPGLCCDADPFRLRLAHLCCDNLFADSPLDVIVVARVMPLQLLLHIVKHHYRRDEVHGLPRREQVQVIATVSPPVPIA